jgi:ferredoxin-NADP reductase
MDASERLPDEVIDHITNADTVFIASVYESEASTAKRYPSHAGMNARGGLPGFTRVRTSDGRTVVLPDYSGNRFLMSLGNVESNGLVGLTIVSFTTGDVLYLTGTAQILVGPPAFKIMARQPSILLMETTGFSFVRDAFPIRQEPGTEVERSPYSPKVKYLCEEEAALAGASGGYKVRLASAVQDADNIATLRFEVIPKPGLTGLIILPGQAIVLDFMDWIGAPTYQHMADAKPGALNDDRVRTWTVSSAHEGQSTMSFELTMREMKDGVVTGALFRVLRSTLRSGAEQPVQNGNIEVAADVVGITGDFYLGKGDVRLLWVAGGIGLTPFLAMSTALVKRGRAVQGDVVLVLASREPDVAFKLLKRSLNGLLPNVHVRIDLFSNQENINTRDMEEIGVQIVIHKGRIQPEYWVDVADERDVLICGPGSFGDAAQEGLRAVGVPASKILREGFY